MDALLRIGWWNTGLAPKKGSAKRRLRRAARLDVASEVVRHLKQYGVGLVAVGEVTQRALKELGSETGYEIAADSSMDTEAGIGLLFDPARVAASFARNAGAALRNRDVTRALEFELAVSNELPSITMIVAHWPSRMVTEAAKTRLSLGSGLQTIVTNRIDLSDEFVIVCGDFNDEPFDTSLTACLYGTRDRRLAERQRRALYNPFWRLLGERKAFEAPPPHNGAGTCFWRSETETHWHTFDQFLFSSAFLRGHGWLFVEGATEVWDRSPLSTDEGQIHPEFDHYPVVVGIRASASESNHE